MMNTRRVVFTLVAVLILLLGLAVVLPARGKPTDSIIVSGASSVLDLSVTRSTGLENLVSGVGPRFVVQYANSMRFFNLAAPPALPNVGPRFVVQYANSMRNYGLVAPQTTLVVAPRIVMQYANSNTAYGLRYPSALIGDHVPPQITAVTTTVSAANRVFVSWTTDEFANGVFSYGARSGSYTSTLTDTLYYRDHSVILTSLASGKYYFAIRSADQSGNTSVSQEYSFTTKTFVYLPTVLKSR